jgi:hypothetical protein
MRISPSSVAFPCDEAAQSPSVAQLTRRFARLTKAAANLNDFIEIDHNDYSLATGRSGPRCPDGDIGLKLTSWRALD